MWCLLIKILKPYNMNCLHNDICLPERDVHEKITAVMDCESVIKEDCGSGHIICGDQIPHNVLEHVMGTSHLDQVLCLL